MIAHLKYFLSAFMMLSVGPVFLVVWIILQSLMKICRGHKMALMIDELMYASYQRLMLFFVEVMSDTKLVLYGDKDVLTKKENIILFGNHQCTMDWIVIAMLAERSGMPGFVKYILKQSLKFMPMYGFYFRQHGYFFVERSGKFKQEKFERQLEELSRHPHPIWLTIFPEGHRYNPENTKTFDKMKQYAKDHDLPVYDHLLTPRTKAFSISLEKLSEKVEAIYDMTFAFSPTLPPPNSASCRLAPPSYFRLFKEEVIVHLHVSRIPVSEVPVGEKFDEWLYSRYSLKDKLLSDFYSKDSDTRGTFGADGVASGLNVSKAIFTASIYFACLLPWLSSWHMFQLYLVISFVLGIVSMLVSSCFY